MNDRRCRNRTNTLFRRWACLYLLLRRNGTRIRTCHAIKEILIFVITTSTSTTTTAMWVILGWETSRPMRCCPNLYRTKDKIYTDRQCATIVRFFMHISSHVGTHTRYVPCGRSISNTTTKTTFQHDDDYPNTPSTQRTNSNVPSSGQNHICDIWIVLYSSLQIYNNLFIWYD